MSTGSSRSEGSYFINIEEGAETARLLYQERFITQETGGSFPPDMDLSSVRDVIDLACGPGGWVLDVAHAHPTTRIIGVDINPEMISYGAAQARTQELDNVKFVQMDIFKPFEFEDHSFDVVNARLLQGFMPRAGWAPFLKECWRITRPGGTIILTECEVSLTNSAAFEKLSTILVRAMHRGGLGFAPDDRHTGLLQMLPRFLRDAGCQNVRHATYGLEFSAGTAGHETLYQDYLILVQLLKPFFIAVGATTEEEYGRLLPEVQTEK